MFRVPSLSSPQAPQLVLLGTVFPHLHSALQGRKLDSLLLAHRVSPLQDAVTRLNVDQPHFSCLRSVHCLVGEEEAFPARTQSDGAHSTHTTEAHISSYARARTHTHTHRQTGTHTHITCTHAHTHTRTRSSQHMYCEATGCKSLHHFTYIVLILSWFPLPLSFNEYTQKTTHCLKVGLCPPQHEHLALPHSLLPQRLQRVQPLHCNEAHRAFNLVS